MNRARAQGWFADSGDGGRRPGRRVRDGRSPPRMARRRTVPPPTQRLILDAGAVIALARNDPRARAYVRRAIEVDAEVRVPVVVLADTLRGTQGDATMH